VIEGFLDHFGEGCVEAEVVEIVVCRGSEALLDVLRFQTVEAVGEGTQIDVD
jgi:hypothetical protein